MKFPNTIQMAKIHPQHIFKNSLRIPWPEENFVFLDFSLTCGNPGLSIFPSSYVHLIISRTCPI